MYGLAYGSNRIYFKYLLENINAASTKYLANIELVFVNDDPLHIDRAEIEDILVEIGYHGKFIYHQNKENKGQAHSRNVGISLSSGDYLHIIDQDDYISHNFYASFFSAQDADLYISTPFFNINDTCIKKAFTPLLSIAYLYSHRVSSLWFLLASNIAYSPGQVILSKDLVNEVGGFPVLEHKGSDDYGLFYNIAFKTQASVKYLNNCRFYYRNHTQQNSKLCNMQASVAEFLASSNCESLKERIIHSLKLDSKLSLFNKFIYILFFRRAAL